MQPAFFSSMNELIGKECWEIIAGPGSGSCVRLLMGAKIPRTVPLKNKTLSEQSRLFDSEFSIFIEEAAWRLESADEVICTSADSNCFGGLMLAGLAKLRGTFILDAASDFPGLDLTIKFSNKLKLKIFCCSGSETDQCDNYQLSTPFDRFSVTAYSKLERKRQGLE